METQANAPAPAQAQPPVHPIHEEARALQELTQWVQNNPDNDPDSPPPKNPETEPKEPPKEETAPKEEAKAPDAETIELDEDSPIFDIEYKTDKGKEQKKLSLKELREGYLAKADYHRNIQKVKAEEAALQDRIKQASVEASQQYLKQLEVYKQALTKAVAPELQNVDLNKLAQDDPAEAQRVFFRQIQFNQLLQGIEAEQRQAAEKFQSERQAAFAQAVEKSRQTLHSDIKDWSNELYTKVLDSTAKDYGFEAKDVEQVVDARLIKVFHDAYQFRQIQKSKPELNRRVVAIPKVVKPGSAEKPNPAQEESQHARDRLKKSGKGEDFMRWYLRKQ